MQPARLGKTGLMVSRKGMGDIPLTRSTEGEAIRVVQRALDLEITFNNRRERRVLRKCASVIE